MNGHTWWEDIRKLRPHEVRYCRECLDRMLGRQAP